MATYEVWVSATLELEFEEKPSEDDVIEFCRRDPEQLLHYLEVESVAEKEDDEDD